MLRVAAVLLLVTSLGAHSASSQNDSESREVAGHTTSPAPPITHPEREIWLNSTEGLPSRQLLGQKQRVRKVPRKPSLRRHPPLGCQQFSWPEGMQSLAIVGNGPLSSRDREQIKTFDAVMRFNKMDNFECGEPVTIWMLRYSYEAPDKYHGLNKTGKGCNSNDVLKKASQVWLMDGEEFWLKEALEKHPNLQSSGKFVWADGRQWDRQYGEVGAVGVKRRKRKWRMKGTSPSSGWLGTSIALECRPPGAEVHLYGFNWHANLWKTHMVDREEQFWRAAAEQNRLVIHETECTELRGCDNAYAEMLEVSLRVQK